MQRAQMFAELLEVGFVGFQFGQALGFQQAAHFLIEVVAELAQLLLAAAALGFQALPFGVLWQAVAAVEEFRRATEKTAVGEDFLQRAAEQHWSYDGNYYFISNNCAVETLKLLRSGSQHPGLHALDSIMPNGLLDSLVARGLADPSVLDDPREALRLGYRFDSFRDRYQAMFEVLRQRLPIEQDNVEDWLTQASEKRRPWFQRADLRASAALLLLEQAALRRQLLLAQDELKRRYLSGRATQDPSLNKAGAALEKILANSGFLSRPAELLDGGYGLPQHAEWQRLETESRNRQQQLRKLSDDLDQEVRNLLEPQRLAELQANEANLTQLGKHLRALHKASGGLMLP